jgi:hypothetical protein
MSGYTYQQLEAMRIRALGMGLRCEWHGERHDDEVWLRTSVGTGILMCWFPGRAPILSVEEQTHYPLDLAHAALELMALHATLTSGFSTGLDWGPEVSP